MAQLIKIWENDYVVSSEIHTSLSGSPVGPGTSSSGTSLIQLNREPTRGHPCKVPKPLEPAFSRLKQCLYSEAVQDCSAPHPIIENKSRNFAGEPLFRPLYLQVLTLIQIKSLEKDQMLHLTLA